MSFEEGEKAFRKGLRGIRVFVGFFEDVVKELVGEEREVVGLRRGLKRRRVSARRDHGEDCRAYHIRI